MPVPMSAKDIDELMGAILDAAEEGDMQKIKHTPAHISD
jgi:hypothetical protein